jgi:NADPH:quinone reductase-like Zn-dependent oxidoreductase
MNRAKMMKAAVVRTAGGPDVLKIEQVPIPHAPPGNVLIRVKAAGVNRSEMFTRQGHSPGVHFPRILGIEATGVVEDAPGGEFARGDIVITAMGGLGRAFDGGYAEYTLVPAANVRRVVSDLPWEMLGALPEMLQTAWGSLFTSLRLQPGERLLIRGGTTSIGLAAAAIAKQHGAVVSATTRNAQRATLLRENGADEVFIDGGSIAGDVTSAHPGGVDKVLELIGTTTLIDSLACARPGGVVCMTGIAGNAWSLDGFNPMETIPTGVYLTSYAGELSNFMATPFQELIDHIAAGTLRIAPAKTLKLEEIVEAHRMMEENRAEGKIVIIP